MSNYCFKDLSVDRFLQGEENPFHMAGNPLSCCRVVQFKRSWTFWIYKSCLGALIRKLPQRLLLESTVLYINTWWPFSCLNMPTLKCRHIVNEGTVTKWFVPVQHVESSTNCPRISNEYRIFESYVTFVRPWGEFIRINRPSFPGCLLFDNTPWIYLGIRCKWKVHGASKSNIVIREHKIMHKSRILNFHQCISCSKNV